MPAAIITQVASSVPFDNSANGFNSSVDNCQLALENIGLRGQAIVQATTASTLNVGVGTSLQYIFTGTTAGQEINLGNATTYPMNGRRYEFWNISTQNIDIEDNGDNLLITLLPQQKCIGLLQDNTTINGTWIFETRGITSSGGSAGTVASVSFAQPGLSAGSYLRIGGDASNNVGYLLPQGTNIVGIAVSVQSAVSGNTVFQIQNRTAVGTLVDIAGAAITITSGNYKNSGVFAISLAAGSELVAYIKSGSTPGFSVFTVFLAP